MNFGWYFPLILLKTNYCCHERKKNMNEILKEEIRRSIRSRGMAMSLILGGIIATAQVIQYQCRNSYWNLTRNMEAASILYPFSAADSWLAGGAVCMEAFIYFLLIPILAVLPFGTSYFSDQTSGFLKGLYTRVSRRDYLTAKYCGVFFRRSGGFPAAGTESVVCPGIIAESAAAVCIS